MAMIPTIKEKFIDLYAESKKESGRKRYNEAVDKWENSTGTKPPYKNFTTFKNVVSQHFKKKRS
jgi:hypothetical protein